MRSTTVIDDDRGGVFHHLVRSLQRRFPEYARENHAFKRHHMRATPLAATVELGLHSYQLAS